jgi:hypothetical protein
MLPNNSSGIPWLVKELLDRPTPRLSVGGFRTQHTQITKLCNDLLPTARRANWIDLLTTEHFLHCGGEPKDWDHIIKCAFAPSQVWRNLRLLKLHKAHDMALLDHYLLNILINGLDCWFKGSRLNPDHFPHRYHQLITEQSAIGWHHLFNGHLSTQWQLKQDYYVC